MGKTITLLVGHPDPAPERYGRALADAYERGARAAGAAVRRFDVAGMEVPFLRTREAFESDDAPPDIAALRQAIGDSAHLAIVYPLWLGTMPAMLKAVLEQTARGSFALDQDAESPFSAGRLTGRSARVVVTMGMPALAYRVFYMSHGLKVLERNILRFVGFGPVRATVIGNVEDLSDARREAWLAKLEALGRRLR